MKIGIDIDGVLTNYNQYVIEKGREYCKKNKVGKWCHPDTLSTIKMFGWSYYHEFKFWVTHIFDYAENNPVMEHAVDSIKKLKEAGLEIHIITSRWLASSITERQILPKILWKKRMRNTVRKWLQKNEILYDHITFIKGSKSRYIKSHHIDVMIEDNPKNIKELSTITKVVCYHFSYNDGIEGKNIYRCHNWKEIYDTVRKIANQELK